MNKITNELRIKYHNQQLQDYEVVITLLAMAKAGKLKEKDINLILDSIFGDPVLVLKALGRASKIADDSFLDSIIKMVKNSSLDKGV